MQVLPQAYYAGPPSAYRPIRARRASQWEAGLKNIAIIGGGGGTVWVNPSSKCASCDSNETDQRNIHTHVNVSSKAYVYDETIYNTCARARFAGCTYLRNIILALNTVYFVRRGCTFWINLNCVRIQNFLKYRKLAFYGKIRDELMLEKTAYCIYVYLRGPKTPTRAKSLS
jgi:hypothetical protein